MAGAEYKLFLNNSPASSDQLEKIREITVDQEVDMAWEARVRFPIVVDEKGHWSGEDEDFIRSFSRLRIELKVGDKPFEPLIDGPVVRPDRSLMSRPGESYATVIVNDDSIYLNQEDKIRQFENIRDNEIAGQIFDDHQCIASTDIEETNQSYPQKVVVQRITDMHMLQSLAKRNGMHAFVLPGENSGESVGCFKAFPIKPDGLTPLTLLGSERNLTTFTVSDNSMSPSNVTSFYLNMNDKSITKYTKRYTDVERMGTDPVSNDDQNAYLQILSPYQNMSADPEQNAAAIALNSSYSFEANGNVVENCYDDLLQPYRVVTIRGINARQSGEYLITAVTHKLSRSSYSQSFKAIRNARSAGSAKGSSDGPLERIL